MPSEIACEARRQAVCDVGQQVFVALRRATYFVSASVLRRLIGEPLFGVVGGRSFLVWRAIDGRSRFWSTAFGFGVCSVGY